MRLTVAIVAVPLPPVTSCSWNCLIGVPAQRVLVVGPDGVPVIAVYPMQRMPDGSWLINGCFLLAYPRDEA